MTKITYIETNGAAHTVDVKPGLSVMQGAVQNCVPGIEADCGGACSCATCHVYVSAEWASKLAVMSDTEKIMLEFANDATSESRLSCQLKVTEAIEGLVVRLPASQY